MAGRQIKSPTTHDLDGLYDRVNDLETGQSAIKTVVNSHTAALERIENKLDNPPQGPGWVAIGGLLAVAMTAMSSALFTVLTLTADPIKQDIMGERQARKDAVTDTRNIHDRDVKKLKDEYVYLLGEVDKLRDSIITKQDLMLYLQERNVDALEDWREKDK